MVTPIRYPLAPTTARRTGTLLDAATVNENFEWLDGNDLFQSFNCLNFGSSADFCGPNAKDFDQTPGWIDGIRFAAYGGVVYKSVGQGDLEAGVRAAFEVGESTAVERALMAQRFQADGDSRWGAPDDITPSGGAVKPGLGVALLEAHAMQTYVGAPVLHLPISVTSLLLGVDGAEVDGNTIRTKLGSVIAAGAGYEFPNTGPTGTASSATERWLYATGAVVVGRSQPTIRSATDYSTNEVFVLAERGYVAAVDCFAAAIRVSLTA